MRCQHECKACAEVGTRNYMKEKSNYPLLKSKIEHLLLSKQHVLKYWTIPRYDNKSYNTTLMLIVLWISFLCIQYLCCYQSLLRRRMFRYRDKIKQFSAIIWWNVVLHNVIMCWSKKYKSVRTNHRWLSYQITGSGLTVERVGPIRGAIQFTTLWSSGMCSMATRLDIIQKKKVEPLICVGEN